MKYIRFEHFDDVNDDWVDEIIVFPRSINHDCMAEVSRGIKDTMHGSWKRIRRAPVSAGFVTSDLKCYGKSESLALESFEEEDTEILRKQFNV